MAFKHTRKSKHVSAQATELAFAAPQVIAHRLARMAYAGPFLSAQDSREFQRMGSEKMAAFYESWNAMLTHFLRSQFELGASMLQSFWFPWMKSGTANAFSHSYLADLTQEILGKGLAPVHRRAVANAKRLGRAR